MEERKFDPYQFIGFILIALILTWMLYRSGSQEAAQNETNAWLTRHTITTLNISNGEVVHFRNVANSLEPQVWVVA